MNKLVDDAISVLLNDKAPISEFGKLFGMKIKQLGEYGNE